MFDNDYSMEGIRTDLHYYLKLTYEPHVEINAMELTLNLIWHMFLTELITQTLHYQSIKIIKR